MKRLAAIFVGIVLVGAAAWLLLSDDAAEPVAFLGYVEGQSVLVAPKQSGRLVRVATVEGADVGTGDFLFALDVDDEEAALAEANARLDRARAQLADLRAERQRPAEIEMLEARRRQAQAALDLSRAELQRQERLYRQNVVAEARLDQARTAFRRDQSALTEVERQIEAAHLAGREAEIEAAEAEVRANEAALKRAHVALAERTVSAPRGGRVLDLLYREGEIVPPGDPVVEILPPENIIVRFYVPETSIAGLVRGEQVAIACDGCPADLTGQVSFIASETEFTPPVIFSREERAKLVFLVEARPISPTPHLKPGLPVEVQPR